MRFDIICRTADNTRRTICHDSDCIFRQSPAQRVNEGIHIADILLLFLLFANNWILFLPANTLIDPIHFFLTGRFTVCFYQRTHEIACISTDRHVCPHDGLAQFIRINIIHNNISVSCPEVNIESNLIDIQARSNADK